MYPEQLMPVLRSMLVELRRTRLSVVAVPAPDPRHQGHKVRVVEEQNPWWYREICSRYPSRSKSHKANPQKHTRVKRRRILEALEKMALCQRTASSFEQDILEMAQRELDRWDEEFEEFEEFESQFPKQGTLIEQESVPW
jgi:hypothetical protein